MQSLDIIISATIAGQGEDKMRTDGFVWKPPWILLLRRPLPYFTTIIMYTSAETLGSPEELHHVPSPTPGHSVSPTSPGPAQLGGRGRSSGNAMLAYWSLRGQGKVFLFCVLRGDP